LAAFTSSVTRLKFKTIDRVTAFCATCPKTVSGDLKESFGFSGNGQALIINIPRNEIEISISHAAYFNFFWPNGERFPISTNIAEIDFL